MLARTPVTYDPTDTSHHANISEFLRETGFQPFYAMNEEYPLPDKPSVIFTHKLLLIQNHVDNYYEVITGERCPRGTYISLGQLTVETDQVVYVRYKTPMQKQIHEVDLTDIPDKFNDDIIDFFNSHISGEFFTTDTLYDLPKSVMNHESIVTFSQPTLFIKDERGFYVEVISEKTWTSPNCIEFTITGHLSLQADGTLAYKPYSQPQARTQVILDPCETLSQEHRQLLERLLKASLEAGQTCLPPGTRRMFLPDTGKWIYVDLKKAIVQKKHENKERPQWEVLDVQLGKGSFGTVYKSGAKLQFRKNGELKCKPSNWAIKVQEHSAVYPEKKALSEYGFSKLTPHLFSHAGPTFSEVDGKMYSFSFVPYFEGVELFDYYLQAAIDFGPRKVLRLMLELAYAIQHQITEAGLVHRDIKLENFIVRRVGGQFCVYSVDFGLSKLESYKDTNEFRGAAGYVSPEVMRGRGSSPKSDIFSLSRIFAVLLGQPFVYPEDYAITSHAENVVSGKQYDEVCTSERMRASMDATHAVILRNLCYFMGSCNPAERASSQDVIDTLQQVIWEDRLMCKLGSKAEASNTARIANNFRSMLRMLRPEGVSTFTEEVANTLNELTDAEAIFSLLAKISGAEVLSECRDKTAILKAVKDIADEYAFQVEQLQALSLEARSLDKETNSVIIDKINHALQKCNNPRVVGLDKIALLTASLEKTVFKINRQIQALRDTSPLLVSYSPISMQAGARPSEAGTFSRKGKEKQRLPNQMERQEKDSQEKLLSSLAKNL